MARNKRRKPKFNGPTHPGRRQGHIDGGKVVRRYDPGRNTAPRNFVKEQHRHQQRGG